MDTLIKILVTMFMLNLLANQVSTMKADTQHRAAVKYGNQTNEQGLLNER